jgi:hypothetical protein
LKQIKIHSEAYLEINAAKQWYESQSEGLGDQFVDEVDRAIECIRELPESWPVYMSGTRRFFVHRFPFAVVYAYDGVIIKVFALMHLRRNPGYWRKRLD